MDFSKTFDCVLHKRLLHKMENYGVRGRTHTWITNFLTKRKQRDERVVVDGDHSQWVQVRSGVPQGTVLCPLLFLVYINDLPDNISSEVCLFADDCVLYRPILNNSDVSGLQADLDTLTSWQNTWQMKFNAKKCFVLKLSHSRSTTSHTYKLGQSTSEETHSHAYLGVHITKNLKWDDQINHSVSKAKRVLNLVRRNLHSCTCTTELKSTAYKTLVRPHLEYSCTVWDPIPHTKELTQKIEMVQHRTARFVCRDYKRKSSVTKMLAQLDWDTLKLRRQAARLTLLYKVTSDQVAIPASKFLTSVAHPTRRNNSKAFQGPTAKKDCYKNSFFPRTISEWNLLPELLVNSSTHINFKQEVTNHLRTTTTNV